MFGGVHERQPGELRDLGRGAIGELGVGVEAGPDGGAADGELVEPGQGDVDPFEIGVELGHVPAELLTQRERHRVLEVGSADLDDVAELLGLGGERVAQRSDRRDQPVHDLFGGGDVHGRRERVVRRLRHVDVVVGMDRLLRPSLPAGELDGAVRDHLVHVHVRLGTAPGLPDVQRELVGVATVDDLVGGLHDELGLLGRELSELLVRERGRLLQDRHAPDHRRWHPVVTDGEVMQRPLGLGAPVAVGGDVDRADAVGLATGRALVAAHRALRLLVSS